MGGFHDDFDFDHDDWDDGIRMDILIPIIVVFIIFCLCTCCGIACKRKREGAIFSTPVVVTSQTHTSAAGPYPVTVVHGGPTTMGFGGVQQPVYPMPQPQPQMQYPPGGYAPQAVPYPTNTPYSMPMPQQQPQPNMMNPPSYNEVVGNEAYVKQAPFNPNYQA